MRRDYGAIPGLTWKWLAFWVIMFQVNSTSSMIYWTAYVKVHYMGLHANQTIIYECECGLYGSDSPLKDASGYVVLPNSDSLACHPNTTFTIKKIPWIALIKRGNCTYTEKIKTAQQMGAVAVVIYNVDETGNETNAMGHEGMAVLFYTLLL